MVEGELLKHIYLYDETTNENISDVFFDNVYELWSKDHKQITLLVDPGRVKAGLIRNITKGRAIKKGHTYRLSILPRWQSLQGDALTKLNEKRFQSTAERIVILNPEEWSLTPPEINSHSLNIDFPYSVDHVAVSSFLSALDQNYTPLEGRCLLGKNGKKVTFILKKTMKKSSYRLAINTRFEDVVGNNFNGAFEHQLGSLLNDKEGNIYFRHFNIP